jgi:hypothetical protein
MVAVPVVIDNDAVDDDAPRAAGKSRDPLSRRKECRPARRPHPKSFEEVAKGTGS